MDATIYNREIVKFKLLPASGSQSSRACLDGYCAGVGVQVKDRIFLCPVLSLSFSDVNNKIKRNINNMKEARIHN